MNRYETFNRNSSNSINRRKDKPDLDIRVPGVGGHTYTVEEAIERVGFGTFQIKLSFVAGLAWIADSMETMVLNILGPTLVCQWHLSSIQEALITTVVFIGFSIGSPLTGYLADKYGRKTSLIMTAAWGAFYGILSAWSPFYSWLLILRGLTGLGLSGEPQAVTYYSEFLPNRIRGKCILLLEVFWALGALVEVGLAMWILESAGWNWWLVASSLPLLIFIPSVLTLPESPRYLLACGQTEQATKALQQVADSNGISLPPGDLRPEPEVPRARFLDLLTPELRKSTVLLWFIWFIGMFAYYGTILLSTELIEAGTTCIERGAGLTVASGDASCPMECQGLTHDDYVQLLWTSAAEIPGLMLTALYIDRVGRKAAMCINFVLYSLCMFLLFICANNAFLVALLFCSRALISSALQVAYVYTPELYPTTVRALGLGSANIFARIGAMITPFIAQVLADVNFGATLAMYGSLGLVAAGASLLLPIETKGKVLQESGH